jgi:hypothetical protein
VTTLASTALTLRSGPNGWQPWVTRETTSTAGLNGDARQAAGQHLVGDVDRLRARRREAAEQVAGGRAPLMSRIRSASSAVAGSACTCAVDAMKRRSGAAPEKTRNCSRGRSASSSDSAGSSKYSMPLAAMPTPLAPIQSTPGQRWRSSARIAAACAL